MGVKDFVKEHCPESMLPVLRVPYRVAAWPYRRFIRKELIRRRALKYLPYYQDELSREILYDNNEFLRTGNNNIFMNRAMQKGWTYTQIKGSPVVGYWEGNFLKSDYTGCVVLYHDDLKSAEYSCNLLYTYNSLGKCRIMSLKEFLGGGFVAGSELIIAAVNSRYYDEIKRYAEKIGLPNDIAGFIWGKHEEIQYVDVFSPIEGEVIVDAGAYTGDTALRFLKWGGDKVRRIYSFEFDPETARKYEENLRPYSDRVTLVRKGTWDSDATVKINPSGTTGSNVFSDGNVEAQLTAIDNVVMDEPVTFIKMDVEGAELRSLQGAKNTIMKNHPRLAICVYHKAEDIYEIPGYILSLVPEYKFLLRRYDSHQGETVLYAYCEGCPEECHTPACMV